MYEFSKLKPLLKTAAQSPNVELKKLALFISNQVNEDNTDAVELDAAKKKENNDEGKTLEQAFKEEDKPVHKQASAFIKDVEYRSLPVAVQREVRRFVLPRPKLQLIHYGMTVKELLPKVDQHNFDTAKEHVAKETVDKEQLLERAKSKYILLSNDSIVDGHHFLARAEKAGITNSIHVLDLTPARFQKKTAWDKLKHSLSRNVTSVHPSKQ